MFAIQFWDSRWESQVLLKEGIRDLCVNSCLRYSQPSAVLSECVIQGCFDLKVDPELGWYFTSEESMIVEVRYRVVRRWKEAESLLTHPDNSKTYEENYPTRDQESTAVVFVLKIGGTTFTVRDVKSSPIIRISNT